MNTTEITRSEFLDLAPAQRERVAIDRWNAGNDAGNGYDGDDVTGAFVDLDNHPVYGTGRSADKSGDTLRAYDTGSEIVVVGDANGPWAVTIAR